MNEKDIAPGLLEELRRLFLALLGLEDEPLTAEDWPGAYAAAERAGEALAGAFGQGLSGDLLPDGRMYWNIADRAVRPLLEEEYALAASAAQAAQQALNEAAGLGLRAVAAPVDAERIEGILNRLAAAERYEDAAWLLDEPVRLLARAAVDETVRRNVEFQAKAGLRPRVVRTAEPGACAWCRALAGSYDYPDVPKDVWRRHENCRCRVEYDPRDGRRQDVWGKRWTEQDDSGILKLKTNEQELAALDNELREERISVSTGGNGIEWESLRHVTVLPSEVLSDEAQRRLRQEHRNLLLSAAKYPDGTEVARTFTLDMKRLGDLQVGESGSGSIQIRLKRDTQQVVIHYHPNGETFSIKDVETLARFPEVQLITAVGNGGQVFQLEKVKELNQTAVLAVRDILDSAQNSINQAEQLEDSVRIIEKVFEEVAQYGIKYTFHR